MHSQAFTPPPPEAIAALRARPNFQRPSQQALIDRLESGEIGNEECLHLLIQESISVSTQAQEQRRLQDEAGREFEAQEQARAREAQEMEQNQYADEPTIISVDAPGEEPTSQVISGSGVTSGPVSASRPDTVAAATDHGGASGSWHGKPTQSPAIDAEALGIIGDTDKSQDEEVLGGQTAADYEGEEEDETPDLDE